jgi:hypothetical protein
MRSVSRSVKFVRLGKSAVRVCVVTFLLFYINNSPFLYRVCSHRN